MSPWALGLAWAFSVASLSIPFPVETAQGGLSRTVLCAFSWIALSGLPRGSVRSIDPTDDSNAEAGRAWWQFYAFLVPLLAVALGLDFVAGSAPAALARRAVFVVVLTGVLACAASRSRGRAGHACIWTLLVPLPFVLLALPQFDELESSVWRTFLSATPAGWTLRELVTQGEFLTTTLSERDLGLVLSTALFFVLSFYFAREKVNS